MRKILFDPILNESVFIDVHEEYEDVNIDTRKSVMLENLKSKYAQKVIEDFTSSATGESVIYGYTQQDQLNYSKWANVLALNPLKESVIIGSVSHGVVSMTREQFIKFMDDCELHEITLYTKRKELENIITNATTIDELNLISIEL